MFFSDCLPVGRTCVAPPLELWDADLLAELFLKLSLILCGNRNADFTESFTFRRNPSSFNRYRESSLDLRYSLGKPYVYRPRKVTSEHRSQTSRTPRCSQESIRDRYSHSRILWQELLLFLPRKRQAVCRWKIRREPKLVEMDHHFSLNTQHGTFSLQVRKTKHSWSVLLPTGSLL